MPPAAARPPLTGLLTQEWRERLHAPPLPAVRFLAINRLTARGALRYGEHRHHEYELILVERGTYRAEINGQRLSAAPGQLVVVQPGDLHDDDFARGVVITGVNLRLVAPGVLPLLLLPGSPRIRQAAPGTAALLAQMQQVGATTDVPAGGLLDALAGQLFWTLAASLPAAERDPQWVQRGADARFLAALEQVFRHHAGRRLPVAGMARAMGLGPTALNDHCRRLLGRSVAAAQLAWRLERADEVLRAGPLAVETVAAQFGFANAFHFSRSFRKHLGYPPSRAGDPPAVEKIGGR